MPTHFDEPPERRQVLAVTLVTVAGYLPLIRFLDFRISAFIALLLMLRAAALRWPQANPGRIALVALTLVGGFNCLYTYHSLAGQRGGTALFVTMLTLKLLEVRTRRDLRLVSTLLGFLIVVQFLFDQSIGLSAYLGLVIFAAVALLVDLSGGMGSPSVRRTLKIALRLSLQALPLAVILFFLFPRLNAPLWNLGLDSDKGITGMSDRLELGSISELVINGDLAFRVRFDQSAPSTAQLYWRGPVLWKARARGWSPGLDPVTFPPKPLLEAKEPIGYEILMEASGQHWLFALDMPIQYPKEVIVSGDFQLRARAPITSTKRYRMESALQYRTAEPDPNLRALALELPPNVTTRMRDLAENWRKNAKDDWSVVQAALSFFNREAFHYTLLPPKLGANPTDEFLFETRQGFCEHYASSFAVLMRVAGIPARIILGYHGGELNEIGGYHMVWQSDAHAWVEVLIPEQGWVRVDPTAAINPARVDNTSASQVLGGAAPLRFNLDPEGPFARSVRQARFLADSIQTAWQDWVLDFSLQNQLDMIHILGLSEYGRMGLALLMVGCGALVLGLILVGLIRQGSEISPLELAYRNFCRKLAAVGLPRSPSEGPADYARRVTKARPDLAAPVGRFIALYIRERYSSNHSALTLQRLNQSLRDFRPRLRRPS